MRSEFNTQLQQLHDELRKMGTMCESAISAAVEALLERREEKIQQTLTIDAGIDRQEREIEALCLRLLLRQQPVAADLRDVSSALKMISDMERIGDQASDIAELARFFQKQAARPEEKHIAAMAKESVAMVNDSVSAFIGHDLTLARQVIAHDDVVDDWFAWIKQELIARISGGATDGEYELDALMAAKYLERIADHATNIAEWVEFDITGKRSKDGVIPE